MDKRSVNIQTPPPDDALRVGDFQLMPIVAKPPVITSHPIRNFHQLTWAYPLFEDGKVVSTLKDVRPILDTYTIRKGTSITWGLYCTDPSNTSNINDLSNLTFVWKRDGNMLYQFNRENNGRGVQFITYTEEECTEELEGTYTCEVSNQYGTTVSVPFNIQIVDVDNEKLLYSNLLLNGDGDGGLDGWTNVDGKITTATTRYDSTYTANTVTTYEQGYRIVLGEGYNPPLPFRFSSRVNSNQLFYGLYDQWNKNPQQVPDWLKWSATSKRFPVIPNEDYGKVYDSPQGFFPGTNYIDNYNQNSGKINLTAELSNQRRPLKYFTKTNIRFEESPTSEFSQNINISSLESLVSGQVGGIDYISAQFFAYVGIAISRYTIRTTQNGQLVEYNWLVHDLDTFRKYLLDGSIDLITPDTGTDIEIIPHTDDTTTVLVDVIDNNGAVVDTKAFNGPQALDVWAVKDKVDWSLMLYPIFAFFKERSNPIKVFGQTYTNTAALKPLFDLGRNGAGNLDVKNLQQIADEIQDKNAQYILREFGDIYSEFSPAWPESIWEPIGDSGQTYAKDSAVQRKAYTDKGAQAFFAIGGTIDLPKDARSLKVRVQFTNDSPGRLDTNPQNKNWTSPEIYNTIYNVDGTNSTVPNAYYAYGSPRCAITKMKLILVPNRDIASAKHNTYTIPPARFTVAGLAKDLALKPVHDATSADTFEYRVIQPEGLPPTPQPTLLYADQFIVQDSKEQYAISVLSAKDAPAETLGTTDITQDSVQRDAAFENNSIDIEESDRLLG